MTALRFRAALATLGRSQRAIAALLHCHPATVQIWGKEGAPDEVLAWVEDGAVEAQAWLARAPRVRLTPGRPRKCEGGENRC